MADDEDTGELWKHDDKTERTPRQRRLAEIREVTEQQAATYKTMKIVWESILDRWRNPWKDAA